MKKIVTLAFIALSVIATAQIPSAGLVGYYQFAGNANDISGSNNNGSLNGATITDGVCGSANNAYSFNGTTNYIEVADSPSLQFTAGQQTISFWLKIPSIPAPPLQEVVFEKFDENLDIDVTGNSATGFWVVFGPSGTLYYSIKNGAGHAWGEAYIPSTALITNQYMHVAFVNNGTLIKAYLNGVPMDTSSIPVGTTVGQNDFSLLMGKGVWTSGGSPMSLLNGQLDNIRIYETGLTDADVLALYHEYAPQTPVVSDTSLCGNGSVMLTANGGSNYYWYASASGGTAIDTSITFLTPVLTTDTTYFVASFIGTCISNRDSVLVDVFPLTALSFDVSSTDTTCSSDGAINLASFVSPTGGTFTGTGIAGNFFLPIAAGMGNNTITYTYTDGNSCVSSEDQVIWVDACVGLKEEATSTDITAYPNPTSGLLNITWSSESNRCAVYDFQGRLVLTQELNGKEAVIDFVSLPQGIYHVVMCGEKVLGVRVVKE